MPPHSAFGGRSAISKKHQKPTSITFAAKEKSEPIAGILLAVLDVYHMPISDTWYLGN